MNNPLNVRDQVVFLVEETTPLTLLAPAATDALVVVGLSGLPNQVPEFTPSDEVANSRSVLGYTQDRMPAGEYSLTTYLRPSGTAGTPPAEAALVEGVMGTETVVAGTSVTYTPAKTLKTYSLWWQGTDSVVFFARGLTVNNLKLSADAKGSPKAEWSGRLVEMGWAGESTLNGALAGAETAVVVDESERFAVGAPITIGTSTGHTVTAIDYTTHTLTVSPAVSGAQADAATVVAALPTPTYSGAAAEAKNAALTLAGVATKYKTFSLEIDNGVEYIEDEVDGTSDYPSGYVAGVRKVSGELGLIVRSQDVARWREAIAATEQAIVWSVDGGAGSIVTATVSQAVLGTPSMSEGSPAVEMSIEFTGRATSAGEDEGSLAYT